MSRAVLVLANPDIRAKASNWIAKAPPGTRVEFSAPKRSLDQNAKLWACLTDISEQVAWHGQKLSPDDWKLVFMDALNREMRIVPAIDGRGFVNLGRSSSKLSVGEMCDLIELIQAFGAQHGVVFHDERKTHQ
jgi:hypothetical protein